MFEQFLGSLEKTAKEYAGKKSLQMILTLGMLFILSSCSKGSDQVSSSEMSYLDNHYLTISFSTLMSDPITHQQYMGGWNCLGFLTDKRNIQISKDQVIPAAVIATSTHCTVDPVTQEQAPVTSNSNFYTYNMESNQEAPVQFTTIKYKRVQENASDLTGNMLWLITADDPRFFNIPETSVKVGGPCPKGKNEAAYLTLKENAGEKLSKANYLAHVETMKIKRLYYSKDEFPNYFADNVQIDHSQSHSQHGWSGDGIFDFKQRRLCGTVQTADAGMGFTNYPSQEVMQSLIDELFSEGLNLVQ